MTTKKDTTPQPLAVSEEALFAARVAIMAAIISGRRTGYTQDMGNRACAEACRLTAAARSPA